MTSFCSAFSPDRLGRPFSRATTIGGSSLLVSTWLIRHTGHKAAPGLWMSFAAVCGLIATLALYRRPAGGVQYATPGAAVGG